MTNMKGEMKDRLVFFNSDESKSDISTEFERSDNSDWITKLTPLLVLDIISLTLLLGGDYYTRKRFVLRFVCRFSS